MVKETTYIQIKLTEEQNKKVEIVKTLEKLNTKAEAIGKILDDYSVKVKL